MRSGETELQTQSLTLQPQNARLNDLMNQIRSASECVDVKNLGLAQQLQTSKFELNCAQTEVSHFLQVVRNQSIENEDAENLRI